jgi:hypothetical protein
MKKLNLNIKNSVKRLTLLSSAFVLTQFSPVNAQTYLAEGFSTASGTTPPTGWTNVAGPGQVGPTGLWDASNPGARTITGADFNGKFFILDSDILGSGNTQDARLTTPTINMSTATNPIITFSEQFRFSSPQTGLLEYSTNGGTSWTTLLTRTADYGYTNPALKTSILVPGAAGQANVKFRWNILTTWGYWWAIDSVVVREAVTPATPTTLTFTAVAGSTTTLNWVDNSSTETAFRVYRSLDNVNFTQIGSVTSTTTAGTGTSYNYAQTGLNPGTIYYYRVTSFVEGESTPLTGSQTTSAPGLILSTTSGGNWSDATTWAGGVVPTATDSVLIVNGAIVNINTTTAACHVLTVGQGVSGYLTFDATTASTLTVQNSVRVNAGATFDAGTGTTTGHALRIGGTAASDLRTGNLTVNGTFDMYTTAGVTVTFFGLNNAQISGTPTVLDFYSVTVNKGAVSTNRPTLTINTGFTVQGANTVGLIGTHTAGVVVISGSYTQANPIYTAAAYTIPLNGGLQLNNPNFTVTATNGSPTCNGLLQVTQGIYNVSTTAAQVLGFGAGATFTVNGGTVNASARILTANAITFTFTSGAINVAMVGNSTSNSASFGITSTASTMSWTGGTLTLVQRSTGATIVDYNVAPTAGISTGTLQIGNAATATNFDFRIGGNVPNLVIDNTTNNKIAQLRAQLNVWGNITVNTGTTLNMNGFALLAVGTTTTNNGFIDGRVASSNFVFYSTVAPHTYTGTGVDTLQSFSNQNTFGNITFSKPVVTYRANFFSTTSFVNSANITLGNGLAQAVTIQVGVANFTGVAGIFDVAPALNLGTGTYSVIYQQEGAMRTTGVEIPASRSIYNLTINDTNNVTLAGGALDVTNTLTLTAGRLNTTGTNIVRITNSAAAGISGGSSTSYVNGPMQRRLPASLTSASTYTFPIGKGTTYSLFELVNPGTNAGGTVDVKVERFNTATGGTPDASTINTLTPQYWSVSITAGAPNIDSTTIRLTLNGLVGINRVAYSGTLTGAYSGVSGGPGVGIITTNKLLGSTQLEGYYSIGEIIVPITGTFIIGASQVSPNYTTLTAAMTDLSTKQVQGNITYLLDADYNSSMETFPISLNQFAASNANYTVTIKPNTGVTTSISGNNATTIIRLTNNARNYIVDGSNNGSSSRDLFIQNTNTGGAVVMFQGTGANQGVQNTIFRNTVIKGGSNGSAYGLIIGGTAVSTASSGLGHKNLTIENNVIYNNYYAVVISGTSATGKVSGALLSKNIIGTDSASFYNQYYGVYMTNADSITLSKNVIKNVKTTGSLNNAGIYIEANTTNSIISGNTISGIYSTSSGGWGAFGINFNTGTGVDNITVRNNAISDILTSNYTNSATTTYNAYGIRILGGNNLKFYFNTVHLFGQPTTGTSQSSSAALSIMSNTLVGLDIRNNIFSNKMTGTVTGSKHYALSAYNAIPGAVFNNNNFIANSSQGILMTAYDNITSFTSADVLTLADLKTNTGANANSVNLNPQFVNDSNLIIGLGTLQGLGTPIAGITLDIVDSLRANPPAIGAYEKGVDLTGPSITYTALPNTSSFTNRVLTGFAAITDVSNVNTTTFKPRIYYKKSTDANTFGTYPGDNNSSFNGWKYAAASNAASPFNFTIDYSLLYGGASVVIGDTIVYFVVAQDLKSPAFNVSANPAQGFTATDVNTITSAPSTVNRFFFVDAPLAGTYQVGAAQFAPNFTTLTSAVNALNTRGVSAAVIFELTDATYTAPAETYPIVITAAQGVSATNKVTIRPASAVTAAITGNTASPLIKLNGADYITIDGSNNGSSSRDLTLTNSSTSTTAAAAIWLASATSTDGAVNNIVKNCILTGNDSTTTLAGIFAGGTVSLGSNALASNNRNRFENNSISKFQYGVWIMGTSASILDTANMVVKNSIGQNGGLGLEGVFLSNQTSDSVSNNSISNIGSAITGLTTTDANGVISPIWLRDCKNTVVSANMINNFAVTGGSATNYSRLYGICSDAQSFITVGNASNNTIVNNAITKALYDGAGTGWNITGIGMHGGYGDKVLFNTVYLSGSNYKLSSGPSALFANGTSSQTRNSLNITVRNNIFMATGSGLSGNFFGHYTSLSGYTGATIDKNNIFVSMTGVTPVFASLNGTNQTTLAGWKTAAGIDLNSINDSTSFVSSTDAHLTTGTIGNALYVGTPVAGITTDVDGQTRHALYPYIGADENTGSPLPVDLTEFTASVRKNQDVLLSWTTASEMNNAGFEIERSADGRDFKSVDFVKGAGNSAKPLTYAYTDNKAFNQAGSNILYYRLKQVDFDGKYVYSQVIKVNKDEVEANALTVFPNPYAADFTIAFTANRDGDAAIEIVDIQGKTVVRHNTSVVSGNNTIPVTASADLNAGVYFVRLTINGESQMIKLVKN